MEGNQDNNYTIDHLAAVVTQIRELFDLAKKRGLEALLVETLEAVEMKLQTGPLDWGDPLHRTHKKGGLVCRGTHGPLVVHYAVYDEEKVVCILKIQPMPGYGL